MSKNKTSTPGNHVFVKISYFFVIFSIIALVVLYSITHDPEIPPLIGMAVFALILPGIINVIKNVIIAAKEKEQRRLKDAQDEKARLERLATTRAAFEEEFERERLEGKKNGAKAMTNRQKGKMSHK